MSPQTISDRTSASARCRCATTTRSARPCAAVLDSGLPALPVIDGDGRSSASSASASSSRALFPGYFDELGYAGFVPRALDSALEKRAELPRRARAAMT